MGLVPAEAVLVVRNRFPGPLILEVKGTRLLLGAGIASRVRVEPCENP
jgi:Fe2+ transport system protein FeoA